MKPANWMAVILFVVLVAAGCRAPVPRVRDVFAAAGSTRIAPPSTNAFTVADSYYKGSGSAASQAAAQPLGNAPSLDTPDIPPAPPYQGQTASTRGVGAPAPGRYVATQDVQVGPPRVRITSQATQPQFQSPYNSAAGGMAVTDLSGREPSTFVPPTRALEIGDLPPVSNRSASVSPNAIVLPGRLGTYSRPNAPMGTVAPVGGSQWQSRP